MFYDNQIKTPKLDLTLPSNNLNEVSLPEMIADPNRSDMDSGHLYGFMILFIDKESNATQFERISSYYGYGMGFDDIGFFGDPNLSYAPTEHFFCVPPKAISFSEPPTTIVQPTLGRTYVKEHQGVMLRHLTISGTTGFRPAQYVSNSLGGVDGRGIPVNERTGFFNFLQLRNLFRYYQTLVSNPQYINAISGGKRLDVVLLWVNFLEGEFWECEPVSFVTAKDASRPIMFNYEINCTCLRKYDSLIFKPDDSLLGQIQEYINGFVKIYEFIGDIQKWTNLASNYASKFASIGRDMMDNALILSNRIVDSAFKVAGTTFGLAMLPLYLSEQCAFAWSQFRNKCESSYSSLRAMLDRESYEHLYSLHNLASAAMMVAKSAQNAYAAEVSFRSRPIPPPRFDYSCGTIDYPDFDRTKPAGADQLSASRYVVDRVHDGETIYTIAKRTLGNENRFWEIVAINNLVPPYVSTYEIEKGVLVPGDEILIPVNNADYRSNGNLVLPTRQEEFVSVLKDSHLASILYGVDIRVTFTGYNGTGYPKVDLMIENGDLVYVEGSNNFLQAMAIKVNTQRGSLKLHPWFGRMFLVGMKSSVAVVAASAVTFKHCILTDPRVAEVDNVKIRLNGDTIDIRLKVTGQRYLTAVPVVVREKV